MGAEVIPMDTRARSSAVNWRAETMLDGFFKALAALDFVKRSSMRETITTFEKWFEAGLLSEAEVDALFRHHGWRRG